MDDPETLRDDEMATTGAGFTETVGDDADTTDTTDADDADQSDADDADQDDAG